MTKIKIVNPKVFGIWVCAIIIGFTYLVISLANVGEARPVRLNNRNLIGNYILHHKLPSGVPVFRLTTPRGEEYVVGRENLQFSLDYYREMGVFGTPVQSK